MDPQAIAAALEDSGLGSWIRTGGWSYAVANVAHLIGLVLLVGPILLLDLRLLGFGRRFDAQAVARTLVPFAAVGIAIMLCSGLALFSADAKALIGNPLMQLKLVGVALGLVNVAWFHFAFARHLGHWDAARPLLARASALLSIALWTSILVAGRLIAYV